MIKLILSVAVATSAMLLVTASAFADDVTWVHPGGIKFCSPYTPSNWRDSITVPQNWTIADCKAFMTTQAASDFQVGCLFSTGNIKYIFSAANPTTAPNPNCGW